MYDLYVNFASFEHGLGSPFDTRFRWNLSATLLMFLGV